MNSWDKRYSDRVQLLVDIDLTWLSGGGICPLFKAHPIAYDMTAVKSPRVWTGGQPTDCDPEALFHHHRTAARQL